MSEKLGRNPFEKSNQKSGRKPPKTKLSKPSDKTTVLSFFKQALESKLDRFSLVRFERGESGDRLSILAVGIRNKSVSSSHVITVGLLKRPLRVDLLRLQIQNI